MENQDASVYMGLALLEARKALEEGEVPVGAIVVKDGRVIASDHNHRQARNDISSHAEIEVLKAAGQVLGTWNLEGCTLYVTLEPCLMCAGAIEQSRISTLIYGADDPQEGAISSNRSIFDAAGKGGKLLIYRGVEKEKCEEILRRFFYTKRG